MNSKQKNDKLLYLVGQLKEKAGHGFARCLDGPNRPRIEIEFHTSREAQECYAVLVELWGGYYTVPNDKANALEKLTYH